MGWGGGGVLKWRDCLGLTTYIILKFSTWWIKYQHDKVIIHMHARSSEQSNISPSNMSTTPPRNARTVYLVTYSQASLDIVPSRTDFATIVKNAFEMSGAGNTVVEHWCCCREEHADGHPHYHAAVKLNMQRRWLSVRNYIAQHYNIQVNFSGGPGNYYEAWQYCSKTDDQVVLSDNHPDFTRAPRTTAATQQKRKTANSKTAYAKTGAPSKKRKKAFDALDLHHIVTRNNIKTKTELLRYTSKQMQEGRTDIALYVLNNTPRAVKVMETCWEMVDAVNNEERESKTRLQLLQDARTTECVPGCLGQWKELASQTLQRNNCSNVEFALAIRNALLNGRGKGRNVLIVGPANCAKTFILKPLCDVFNAFVNPASGTFAWVGVEQAEIIFLNDFRWSEHILPWQDMLRLLEGDKIHVPTPKTHFAKDIILDKDTPIFCTSPSRLRNVSRGVVNEVESEMMDVRWKTFTFFHQLSRVEAKDVPSCPKCFAELVLQ